MDGSVEVTAEKRHVPLRDRAIDRERGGLATDVDHDIGRSEFVRRHQAGRQRRHFESLPFENAAYVGHDGVVRIGTGRRRVRIKADPCGGSAKKHGTNVTHTANVEPITAASQGLSVPGLR